MALGAVFAIAGLLALPASAQQTFPRGCGATRSGICLDAPWKAAVYEFALQKLKHPGWGVEHSERNYQIAMQLARAENMVVDEDVIFATAFLHDMDAIGTYSLTGIAHGAGSAREAEPILRDAGFPMAKFPAVRESMITHMYTSAPSKLPEAIVMHDADALEFLGAIGIARSIALIGDRKDLTGVIASVEKNRAVIPGKLITKAARTIAVQRVREMDVFLEALNRESFMKAAL